jgi:hypothetical protein
MTNYIHTNEGLIPIEKITLKHRTASPSGKIKQISGIRQYEAPRIRVTTEFNSSTLSESSLLLTLLPNLTSRWMTPKEIGVGSYVAFNHDLGLGAPSEHLLPRPNRMSKEWATCLAFILTSYSSELTTPTKLVVSGASDLSLLFYKCADFPYSLEFTMYGESIIIEDPKTLAYLATLFGLTDGKPTKIPDCIMESSRLETSVFLSVILIRSTLSGCTLRYEATVSTLNQIRQLLWSYFNVLSTIEENTGAGALPSLRVSDSALYIFSRRIKFRSQNKNAVLMSYVSEDTPNRCLWVPYAKENNLPEYKGGELVNAGKLGDLYQNKFCWQKITSIQQLNTHTETQLYLNTRSSYGVNGMLISKPTEELKR